MIQEDSSNAGRPPKGKAKRSYKITVSFNEDEILMMRHKARETGMTPAAYCRRAAVRKQIAKALTEEDRKLLRSLGNIGNNLNQLVHNLHAYRIIHAANPEWNAREHAFIYPNGRIDRLKLNYHL